MNDDVKVRRYIVIDESELAEAEELAQTNDVTLQVSRLKSVEPISAGITLVLIGSALAVATIVRVLEQRKGGQVVDLRPGATKQLYRSSELLYGLIAIFTPDGQVTVEVKEPTTMFSEVVALITKVAVEKTLSNVGEVRDAVTDALTSGSATTSVTHNPPPDLEPGSNT